MVGKAITKNGEEVGFVKRAIIFPIKPEDIEIAVFVKAGAYTRDEQNFVIVDTELRESKPVNLKLMIADIKKEEIINGEERRD